MPGGFALKPTSPERKRHEFERQAPPALRQIVRQTAIWDFATWKEAS